MTKKKIMTWTAAAVVGLIAITGLVSFFVLRSRSFHNFALAKIISAASSATGGRVEVENYSFQFVPLRVDIYNLVVHGTESRSAPPLAQADHLGVGLKLVSLLHQKVDLKEIILDRPRINFLVDPQGRSNLPKPQNPNSSNTNIFDLAISHTQLNHGEICYNDRQWSLDADLHDLQSQINFATLKKQYEGTLNYRQGLVKFGNAKPIQHDLRATFVAARAGLTLQDLSITSGSSHLTLSAKLADYSRPVIDGTYQVVLSAADLRRNMLVTSASGGEISTNGSLHYQAIASRPFLDTAILNGTLSSPRLVLDAPQFRGEARAVNASYHIENGNLYVPDLRAALLGGQLNASLAAQHLATTPQYQVEGALHSVSLAALNATAGKNRMERAPLEGSVDARLQAAWTTMSNLQLRSDATLSARAASVVPVLNQPAANPAPIPINGVLHLRYDGSHSLLSLTQSFLRTPATELRFNGTVGNQAALSIQMHSTNLREIDLLALRIREASSPRNQSPPQLFGLYGAADFAGQTSGPTNDLHLTGLLTARNLQVQGSKWQSLRTNVALDPHSAALQHGELVATSQGRIQFDVKASLHNWSYTYSNPIDIQAHAAGLPAPEIERLAKLQYPVAGTISGNVALHGTELNPHGQASLQLVNGKLWNQAVQSLTVDVQGTGESLHTTMKVQSSIATGSGKLDYAPRTQVYDLALNLRSADISSIDALRARSIQTRGPVTLSARGHGTVKAPELQAALDVPELQVGQQTISKLHGTVEVAQQRAKFDFASSVATSSVQLHGSADLNAAYQANATLEAQAFPLGPLFAAYLPASASGLDGQLDLHASLTGPLKDPARLEVNLEIPTLKANYQTWELANQGPIRAAYREGVFKITQAQLKGADTDIQLQGAIPIYSQAPMDARLHGNADLKVLSLMNKQTSSEGQLVLDVTATGPRAQPVFGGHVKLINAGFSTVDAPLGAENVNAEIDIKNNRFEIVRMDGQSGGGNIAMHGFVAYQSGLRFNLALDATTVRLRYPDGLRAILDGRLTLNGSSDSSTLNGNVTVQRLSFTHDFDLATFMGQFGTDASAPPSQGLANNIQLDVAVQSSGDLGLESTKLSLQGQANLRLRGTAANPVIIGRANITDGQLFFLNNRYHIEQAIVNFANPVRTEPVVNLLATTKINNFDLSINMVGPIDRLRTSYISDPPLPPVDIINLLTRGSTGEQATPGSLGANALLAKGLASQVSSRLEKLGGISSLQIDPLLGGSNRNPSARVALQEKITKDIIFTYAADVTSTQNELIQIEYQVTPLLSLRVLRDERGNYSIEGRHHKNF